MRTNKRTPLSLSTLNPSSSLTPARLKATFVDLDMASVLCRLTLARTLARTLALAMPTVSQCQVFVALPASSANRTGNLIYFNCSLLHMPKSTMRIGIENEGISPHGHGHRHTVTSLTYHHKQTKSQTDKESDKESDKLAAMTRCFKRLFMTFAPTRNKKKQNAK